MIELKDVFKSYETFSLKGISFKIERGEYLVILGPSGAGKTVVLELIAGLLYPDHGLITGMENKQVGYIYQDYMLFPHMNVMKNICYGLRMRGESRTKQAEVVSNISEILGIDKLLNRDVATLSGGEKQRVAIARAMAIKPEIYLIDEPTAALDIEKRRDVQAFFREIHRETGTTFLHVTHDFEEALALADRIIVLNGGKIEQIDTPTGIFKNPSNSFVARFVGHRNLFHGSIRNRIFTGENISFNVETPDIESCNVLIKGEEIILSTAPLESSARNCIEGTVKDILKNLYHVEVIIDAGVELRSRISFSSLGQMGIKPGSVLYATFKSSSVKVLRP